MGFCDLHLCNLALMGKYGWRFLMNPNILCARVLKGRYFSDSDFTRAMVPKSSSATWRAIVVGREALLTGLIKCVGDGSSISVWNDQWVPSTIKMSSMLRPPVTQILMVSVLIDTNNWTWRRELVHYTFILPATEAILNILCGPVEVMIFLHGHTKPPATTLSSRRT